MRIPKTLKNIVKGNNRSTLLLFNIILYGNLLIMPFVVELNPLYLIGSLVMYFLLICCGVSTTYHRSLTHRAFVMPKWLERTFATFACLAGTGSPIMWVMTHRQHHVYADKEGDPHPPHSLVKTLFGVYPRVSSPIRDIVRDRYYAFWHRYYFGLLTLFAVTLALIGPNAYYFFVVVPVVASVAISNALNWFGHKESTISYRTYDLRDDSQNNPIMAALAFGEGWHNNHHRHPGSARFGLKPWEFDVSFLLIKTLERLGLASSIKYPDPRIL